MNDTNLKKIANVKKNCTSCAFFVHDCKKVVFKPFNSDSFDV